MILKNNCEFFKNYNGFVVIFIFYYLFIFREQASVCVQGGGGEREGENPKQVPCPAGHGAVSHNPEIVT